MAVKNDSDDDFLPLTWKDWASIVGACCLPMALIVVVVLALAGCATVPPPAPSLSAFERCMVATGSNYYYTSDKIRAATWCRENDNGGMR
jgi:hypothetical protein